MHDPQSTASPVRSLPGGVEILETPSGLELRVKWLSARHYFFAIIFLYYLYQVIVYDEELVPSGLPWPFMALLVAALAAMIGMGGAALYGFLNRTIVRVSSAALTVHHEPLPWFGTHRLAPQDIAQLYVTEKALRERRGRVSYVYSLFAETVGDRRIRLVRGLESKETAVSLEKAVEARLGITDRPVEEPSSR